MNIFVNSEPFTLEDNATIMRLLVKLTISGGFGYAVAVNNEVIARTQWESFPLKENDNIVLIKAAQGG